MSRNALRVKHNGCRYRRAPAASWTAPAASSGAGARGRRSKAPAHDPARQLDERCWGGVRRRRHEPPESRDVVDTLSLQPGEGESGSPLIDRSDDNAATGVPFVFFIVAAFNGILTLRPLEGCACGTPEPLRRAILLSHRAPKQAVLQVHVVEPGKRPDTSAAAAGAVPRLRA